MLVGVIHYGLAVGLAIALLFAAFTDIRRRQIDNWLNAAIALAAPLFWWSGGLSLWPDMAMQFGFALLVTAVLIGLYAMRTMGGGDVKLLAALSLWLAPGLYFTLVVIMALAGGLLTIGMIMRARFSAEKVKPVIPYGVAIAIGGLWVLNAQYALIASTAALAG